MRELGRSWPIGMVLVLALGAQVLVLEAEPLYGRQLVALGLSALTCVAVLWAHRPVAATVCVCASVLVTTSLISGLGRAVFLDTTGVNGLRGFDLAPGAVGDRRVGGGARAGRDGGPDGVAAGGGGCRRFCRAGLRARHPVARRPPFVVDGRGDSRVVVLLGVLSVGYGVLLRTRDGERAATATSAVERVRQDERLDLARVMIRTWPCPAMTRSASAFQAARMTGSLSPAANRNPELTGCLLSRRRRKQSTSPAFAGVKHEYAVGGAPHGRPAGGGHPFSRARIWFSRVTSV
jgi:hypothetical protein